MTTTTETTAQNSTLEEMRMILKQENNLTTIILHEKGDIIEKNARAYFNRMRDLYEKCKVLKKIGVKDFSGIPRPQFFSLEHFIGDYFEYYQKTIDSLITFDELYKYCLMINDNSIIVVNNIIEQALKLAQEINAIQCGFKISLVSS